MGRARIDRLSFSSPGLMALDDLGRISPRYPAHAPLRSAEIAMLARGISKRARKPHVIRGTDLPLASAQQMIGTHAQPCCTAPVGDASV